MQSFINGNSSEDVAVWVDGLDPSTIFQDPSRTIPATFGSGVNGWADKSSQPYLTPNNNHLTNVTGGNGGIYNANVVNGLPGITFNGTGTKGLLSPSILATTNSFTLYLVRDGAAANNSTVLLADTGTNFWVMDRTSGTPAMLIQNNIASQTISNGFSTGPTIFELRFDGHNMSLAMVTKSQRRNLKSGIYGGRINALLGNINLSGSLSLGAFPGGTSFNPTCSIGEFSWIKRAVTEEESRFNLESLSGKWGIGNLPFVLCVGDSLTDGSGTTAGDNGSSYPELLQAALGSGYIVERSSYPGRNLDEARREMYRDVTWRSWPRACNNQQVAVLWFGANDAVTKTFDQFTAEYTEHVSRLIGAGYSGVIATTLLPRSLTPGSNDPQVFEAIRAPFNAWLRLNYRAIGCCGLLDVAANNQIGAASANLNTAYYQPDQIHLNLAGNQIVSGLLVPLIAPAMTFASIAALAALPDPRDVRVNVDRGDGVLGTLTLPPSTYVDSTQTYDNGIGGDLITPPVDKVLNTVLAYGPGAGTSGGLTGEYVPVTVDEVRNGVTFGPNGTLTGTYMGSATSTSPAGPLPQTTVDVFAFVKATSDPKTGDAANITCYVSIDDGPLTPLTDTSANEKSAANAAGFYTFNLTLAERTGTKFIFSAKSTTAGVEVIVPGIPFFAPVTIGNETVNVGDTEVDWNYNGNDMRVLRGSVGIGGIQVFAWLATEYAASPNTALIKGYAVTNDAGQWSGMRLSAGQTYTILAEPRDGSKAKTITLTV